ncbi:MAG TPA: glycosyltransferase [Mycobacterium sp.]|nr:glycosyltransferase [Mycobacterium sp.]HUH72155.1 glycosyltransferase [Mycobacterium sp.]
MPDRVDTVGPRAVASPPKVLPYVGDWADTLGRVWSTDRPDVVHAYGWLGGLATQLAARRQRISTVQTFLGLAATSRSHLLSARTERANGCVSSRYWRVMRPG